MEQIHARTLLDMSTDDIFALLDVPYCPIKAIFDDGEIVTRKRDLIYSQYYWAFHREYPNTPLEIKHLIPPTVRINKNTPLLLLENAFWSAFDAYHGELHLPTLCKLAYWVINNVYNEIVTRIPEYVTGFSARDVIEVIFNPQVRQILDNAHDSQEGYELANDQLYALLKTEGFLPGNRTAEAIKSGLLAKSPTSQMYGIRGPVADIDNTVFPNLIKSNYCIGHHLLHDYATESRSASKFLYLAGSPLQQVEYKNREFQLLAQSLRYMFKGDCQSKHLLPITIQTKDDLDMYDGKYYYVTNPETGKEEMHRIIPEDTHLIGQKLYVRSVLGCHCLPKQGVCEVCVGELALHFTEGCTVGHFSIIELCSGISQSVLSAKHLDVIRRVLGLQFTEDMADIIELYSKRAKDGRMVIKPGERRLRLKSGLRGKSARLVIAKSTNLSLPDITQGHPIETLCLSRTSHIRSARIEYEVMGQLRFHYFDLMIGARAAHFTSDFLMHIKNVNYDTIRQENVRGEKAKRVEYFSIPLDGWDFSKPVFDFPHRVDTMWDFMKQLVSVVKAKEASGPTETDGLLTMEWLAGNVMRLYELVNSRFKLNLAHCEIIISLCLVRNSKNDFRFPSPDGARGFAPFNTVMQKRSLSATYAYEKHLAVYLGITSFLNPLRPSHTMDKIYYP